MSSELELVGAEKEELATYLFFLSYLALDIMSPSSYAPTSREDSQK